jgi:hypothetical protein
MGQARIGTNNEGFRLTTKGTKNTKARKIINFIPLSTPGSSYSKVTSDGYF